MLGKETTILFGGHKAKHNTSVHALHTGTVAASLATSLTSHTHLSDQKPDMKNINRDSSEQKVASLARLPSVYSGSKQGLLRETARTEEQN